MTSSWIVERRFFVSAANDSISAFAVVAFSRERAAMITWWEAEALAMTFAAAKPTPEFAPRGYRSASLEVGLVDIAGMFTSDEDNRCGLDEDD